MTLRCGYVLVVLLLVNSLAVSAREIAIQGATVIDGTGRPPIPNATVLIGDDGKIRSVTTGQTAPAGAEVVEARGKYLIPGLWDMHVHYRWWMPELFLHYGVTTIQSVGDPVDWILAQRDGVAKGKIVGPRILACGEIIGAPKTLEDTTYFRVVDGTEDALRLARGMVAKNVDCLKVWSYITPEEVKVVAEQAHRAGKPLVGHAVKSNAIITVESGVDQLAHAQGIAEASIKDPAMIEKLAERGMASLDNLLIQDPRVSFSDTRLMMDPEKTKEVLQFLLKKGTFLEPDLINSAPNGNVQQELIDEWFMEDSMLFQNPDLQYIPDYFPARALPYLRRSAALTPERRNDMQRGNRNIENVLKDYAQAGGRIMTGSDTSSEVTPGISLHREMELLVRAGLTPMQVIQASSYNPALFYKKDNEFGSLQAGRYADLIILDADPLADIKNTRKISAVYKEGKLVDRSFHADFSNPIPEPYSILDQLHGYPVPRLRRISPMAATEGDPFVEVTLTGSGFIPRSVASFDGHSVPAKWISPTELRITVPGWLLERAGTFPVIVTNPKPVLISDPLHEDERSSVEYFIVRFK